MVTKSVFHVLMSFAISPQRGLALRSNQGHLATKYITIKSMKYSSNAESTRTNKPPQKCESLRSRIRLCDWSLYPIQEYIGGQTSWTEREQDEFPFLDKEVADAVDRRGILTQEEPLPLKEPLNIVYVDDQIVVINKPSGVMSVPGPRRIPSTLEHVYQHYGSDIDHMDCMVVHRLDRDTSGLVVYGRTQNAVKQLHEDFRRRRVKKQYVALVCGHVQANEGEIDLPLARDGAKPPFMRVATPDTEASVDDYIIEGEYHPSWQRKLQAAAKQSLTTFEVISRESLGEYPVTRVALYPETGRTHQLRVHCAAIGHPIVADPLYGWKGAGSWNAGFSEQEMDFVYPSRSTLATQGDIAAHVVTHGMRLCLHAQQLTFWHPTSRAPFLLLAPPPF